MARRDAWSELCELVKQDDGLATRPSGAYVYDKLWNWHHYLSITSSAMVGHQKWPQGVVYVDLFAGPGVCTLKGSGTRVPGSPLIAAYAPKPFTKILLCELKKENADACANRLARTPAAGAFQVFEGDCNEIIADVVRAIPHGALTIAFVDPTGLHAKLATLRTLSDGRAADLLILFPDAVDIIRNLDSWYLPGLNENLDDVMGPNSGWRDKWKELGARDSVTMRQAFAAIHRDQLRLLGYAYFDQKIILHERKPLYRLIYATKNPRGLDFWQKANKNDRQGQRKLF